MLSPPDSPRGKLLSQYVLARIIRMDGVNIGLFDHDKYNTLYYYAMNADEQIYLRYGGRDSAGHTSYLSLDSIELALERGLALHERYEAGEIAKTPGPEPVYPRDFPLLMERTNGAGRCVECHLIADFRAQEREADGIGDRRVYMYRSPDIKRIGIWLDVPRGLVLERSEGAAAAAGIEAGDEITHVAGRRVHTFADLQYYYAKTDRDAREVGFTVERGGGAVEATVTLPPYWWESDLSYRQWTIEPRVYFESDPLTAEEKATLGLPEDGFASRVTDIDGVGKLMGAHNLEEGDVVFSVDGEQRDEHAYKAELHIKLRKVSGSTVELGVIRDGERITMPLRTARMSFRK